MSGEQRRHLSHGDSTRPRVESLRPQLASPSAVPSIETPEQVNLPARPIVLTPQTPSQTPQFRVPESPGSGAKVAIPRLKRSIDAASEGSSRLGARARVNRACEPCRQRKTKCSGEQPVCRHCQDFKIACFYADGKRDRVKKQIGSMSEKVADYETLLLDLVTRVSEEDAKLIKASLAKETSFDLEDSAVDTLTVLTADVGETAGSGAESEVSAGKGSNGAADRTDEDFTREQARSTGFLGKNSEVTWLQRLRRENEDGGQAGDRQSQRMADITFSTSSVSSQRAHGDRPSGPFPERKYASPVHDSSYHLDDMSISTFEAVDPYEIPTSEVAHQLFNAYIVRVHPSFPVIGKLNLTDQFHRFISGVVPRPPDQWLAIVNLIFAISAKYSHLVQADWKGDDRDHLIYFTRARLLSMNSETMFQHPDLQQIQILGLTSFYFMCTSQINRAWIIAGAAIRGANALGMNMRNDSPTLKDSLKEIRYRLWWALYTLEHRLCSMTGRVSCIMDDHCTTPLPIPLEEEQFETEEAQKLLSKATQQGDRAPASNPHTPSLGSATPTSSNRSRSATNLADSRSPSALQRAGEFEWAKDVRPNASLYFLHLVQLTRLTESILHNLYSPSSIQGTWSLIQTLINDLDVQLENWSRKLPPVFDFKRNQHDRDFYEYRLTLGFFYYGTKMTIHRPCLCRLDRKIPGQSIKSHEFNRHAAATCVESAIEILRMIPDEPNAVGLIRVAPWWDILHSLVQAATVLMLEISFRAHHMPQDADTILEASKKVVRWLHALGEDNPSARRAWTLCDSMLRDAVGKIGRDVGDLPEFPPGRSNLSPEAEFTTTQLPATNPFLLEAYRSATIPTSVHATTGTFPVYQTYSTYDPMMQYDQYFPVDTTTSEPMSYYQQPTDAEIEFLSSAYHEDQGHQQQGDQSGGGPRYGQ